MLMNSMVCMFARVKIKVHGAGGECSWWMVLALLGVLVAIWGVVFWVERRSRKNRKDATRLGIELARQKGCVDSAERCWFCGNNVDGRAIMVPLNNRVAVIEDSWQVKKVPVFCCEKCQGQIDVTLLMGHPRIAPLLEGDYKIGTGK